MLLHPHQQEYLQGLKDSPVWLSILKDLRTAKPPPRYTPSKKGQNYDLWVYNSGGEAATQAILSILYNEEVTQEDLK